MNYEKERLFDDAIRGIIESVENINCKYKLLEKGLICMEKTDHNAHSVYLMYYHLIMHGDGNHVPLPRSKPINQRVTALVPDRYCIAHMIFKRPD